jgi:hypothetical protein
MLDRSHKVDPDYQSLSPLADTKIISKAANHLSAGAPARWRASDMDYSFAAERMHGTSFDALWESPVVYLVTFAHEGQAFIKFGRSNAGKFRRRVEAHMKHYPQCRLFSAVVCADNAAVEARFMHRMLSLGHLTDLALGSTTHKEILKGATPEAADAVLVAVAGEVAQTSSRASELDDDRRAFERAQHDDDVRLLEMLHERAMAREARRQQKQQFQFWSELLGAAKEGNPLTQDVLRRFLCPI